MAERTTRDFAYARGLWETVDSWAAKSGFKTVLADADHRVYQKGNNGFDFPVMLEISWVNGRAHLQTWVKASALNRTRALFMVPSEIGLESGGMQLAVPRRNGRSLLNQLLGLLGQPPIP